MEEIRDGDDANYIFSTTNGRTYTSVRRFALKYSLGNPVAGNFYLCSWDPRSDVTLAAFGTFPEYIQRAFTEALG